MVELKNEPSAIRRERPAGGGPCFFKRIGGKGISDLGNQTGRSEGLFNIFALQINIRINLVGYAVITLVAVEADVVGCRADPKSLSINLERRFPNSEVIAGGHHSNRLSMRPTVILRAAKQIQGAHPHG